MILRDADTGKVIWQENKDLSSSEEEHRAQIPTKILDLRAVSREINFSTVESLKNFRLDQKVRPTFKLYAFTSVHLCRLVLTVAVHYLQILFKGRIMEEWLFEMGWVSFKGHLFIRCFLNESLSHFFDTGESKHNKHLAIDHRSSTRISNDAGESAQVSVACECVQVNTELGY